MTENVRHESDVKHVRRFSKALFGGARYRLEVASAIAEADDGVVSTTGLAEALGIAPQSVHQELRVLVRTGLVARTDDLGTRQVFFRRLDSPYWEFCRTAFAEAAAMLERNPPE